MTGLVGVLNGMMVCRCEDRRWFRAGRETTMLADQTRWSPGHGKTPVPSRWQATGDGLGTMVSAASAVMRCIRRAHNYVLGERLKKSLVE